MEGWKRAGYFIGAVGLFVFSLQLLTSATGEIAGTVEVFLGKFVTGDLSSFGSSWLTTYFLLNGSSVAAVSLSLLSNGLLSTTQAFMAISGSRIGAAFTIVLIGFLEYFRGKNDSFLDSCSVGIISFLVAYLLYIPAVVLGYVFIRSGGSVWIPKSSNFLMNKSVIGFLNPAVGRVINLLSPGLSVVMALTGLFLSLEIFDRAFSNIGNDFLKSRYFRFIMDSKWVSFGMGAILTLLTTSVSVSLGLIVPLYNTGYIRRHDMVPYIIGSNITTLVDTLAAAFLIGSADAVLVVTVLMLSVILTSVVAVLNYERFYRILKYFFDLMVRKRIFLYLFIFSMVVIPALFLVLGR